MLPSLAGSSLDVDLDVSDVDPLVLIVVTMRKRTSERALLFGGAEGRRAGRIYAMDGYIRSKRNRDSSMPITEKGARR